MLTILSVPVNAGEYYSLEVTPAKLIDQDTAQAENTMWVYRCDKYQHKCPRGYHFVDLRGDRCACLPRTGAWKRDANDAPQINNALGRFPFDPKVYCTNAYKGRCPNGQVGLWDSRGGRCFCGSAKTVIDLATMENKVVSPDAIDLHEECVRTMGGHCGNRTVGLWDSEGQHCHCPTTSKNLSVDTGRPTTSKTLTGQLLPQPLKYPTNISNTDWTAIQVTLVLLDETIKSQMDFRQVCTGEKDLQAFGFKNEVFGKICNREITMPVAQAEIAKAQKKVYSALWIDTILERHHNGGLYDFYGACEEARVSDAIPPTLDKEYILSQLCYRGH